MQPPHPSFTIDGRKYLQSELKAVRKHTGWQIMDSQWVRDPFEGWDEIDTPFSSDIYATQAEADAEIARINARPLPAPFASTGHAA